MAALDVLDSWPAPHASAAVVGVDGLLARHGDTARVFPWASVTKLVTALATLVAVEEGTVALDDPAGPPGSTVRHLLAHASGLAPDRDEVLAPPGKRRIYSNRGFEVLAEFVAARAAMPFTEYAHEAVVAPLAMSSTTFVGSPASGAAGPLDDLARLARELLSPTLVAPPTLDAATRVQFPGLPGVLPGFGRHTPNDWGLGFELRDGKSPHWTGARNAPRTFGHFGRSGTFLWVDPDAHLGLGVLTDLDFDDWAASAWPDLSDAVLAEFA